VCRRANITGRSPHKRYIFATNSEAGGEPHEKGRKGKDNESHILPIIFMVRVVSVVRGRSFFFEWFGGKAVLENFFSFCENNS
jgi:hypothetical protein